MQEYVEIDEAIYLLKDKLILKDAKFNKFIYKKKRICVYSTNSFYSLKEDEFKDLFKDTKFYLDESNECTIDLERDKEYYNFKHK